MIIAQNYVHYKLNIQGLNFNYNYISFLHLYITFIHLKYIIIM